MHKYRVILLMKTKALGNFPQRFMNNFKHAVMQKEFQCKTPIYSPPGFCHSHLTKSHIGLSYMFINIFQVNRQQFIFLFLSRPIHQNSISFSFQGKIYICTYFACSFVSFRTKQAFETQTPIIEYHHPSGNFPQVSSQVT